MNKPVRLAIITTDPIQYNAPMFRLLASRNRIDIHVFYTWGESVLQDKFDPGFGKAIQWDVPLLEGYAYSFVKNISSRPGSDHYHGIDNPDLIRDIEAWKADAVLVYGWNYRSHLKAMRYFKGRIPVLFRGDSTLLDEQPGMRKYLRRAFLTWIYRHVDIALYVGRNSKTYFAAHGLKEHQLVFAPHAIDNDRFGNIDAGMEARVRSWRQELGFADEDLVVMFAGKLEPKKHPQFLLELGSRMEHLPRVRFLIVGNGVLEAELRKQVEGDGRFVFLGFQNQSVMPLVYRMGDIFLLPSKGPGETWGLALNEAMACGLPVMASDRCGGSPDLIGPDNGLIFPHNDVGPAKAFLERVAGDPSLLKKMGAASAKQVERFNFAAVAEAIENCCLQQAGNGHH